MRDRLRIAGFSVAVVVVFGLAFGLGRAVGPVGAGTPPPEHPTMVTTIVPPPAGGPGVTPATHPLHGGAPAHPTTTSTGPATPSRDGNG